MILLRALSAVVLSTALLGGCAAGNDLAQTAAQEEPGGEDSAQVEVSKDVTVATVGLQRPADGDLAAGDDVDLRLVVSNTGSEDDELRRVTGPGFGAVGGGPWVVPAQGELSTSAPGSVSLTLPDLAEDVAPGESLQITFSFQRSGDVTLSVPYAG